MYPAIRYNGIAACVALLCSWVLWQLYKEQQLNHQLQIQILFTAKLPR
jgi:hypothetical protein